LTSRRVNLKQADMGKSRDTYIEQLNAVGGGSLLFVVVDMQVGQMRDKITVDCYDQQGKRLWREEVSKMFSGTPKKLAKNMAKKLESRLGKEGLPVGAR
jgi:hypothetical protein